MLAVPRFMCGRWSNSVLIAINQRCTLCLFFFYPPILCSVRNAPRSVSQFAVVVVTSQSQQQQQQEIEHTWIIRLPIPSRGQHKSKIHQGRLTDLNFRGQFLKRGETPQKCQLFLHGLRLSLLISRFVIKQDRKSTVTTCSSINLASHFRNWAHINVDSTHLQTNVNTGCQLMFIYWVWNWNAGRGIFDAEIRKNACVARSFLVLPLTSGACLEMFDLKWREKRCSKASLFSYWLPKSNSVSSSSPFGTFFRLNSECGLEVSKLACYIRNTVTDTFCVGQTAKQLAVWKIGPKQKKALFHANALHFQDHEFQSLVKVLKKRLIFLKH